MNNHLWQRLLLALDVRPDGVQLLLQGPHSGLSQVNDLSGVAVIDADGYEHRTYRVGRHLKGPELLCKAVHGRICGCNSALAMTRCLHDRRMVQAHDDTPPTRRRVMALSWFSLV